MELEPGGGNLNLKEGKKWKQDDLSIFVFNFYD